MAKQIYGFLNDLVFKAIFGCQKNERLLICLLNALLLLEGESRLRSVVILNPFNLQEHLDDKLSILDVKAEDERGSRYNIEVQCMPHAAWVQRALFYLARLFVEQMSVGADYAVLRACTGVSLLDFELFPDLPHLRNAWRFRRTGGNEELPGTLEWISVELTKFGRDPAVDRQTRFGKWLRALKWGDKLLESGVTTDSDLLLEEGIAMAFKELDRVNADRELRYRIEAREKFEHVQATLLGSARREGLAEGEAKGRVEGQAEGRAEERKALVQRLLATGKSVAEIAALTGWPEEEIGSYR